MSLLLSLFNRRSSAENPSTPVTYESIIGGDSESITLDHALQVSAVFRAVSLISKALGKVGTHVYERTASGKERALSHPAYRLLVSEPNDRQTPMTFKQTLFAHAILQGGGYAYIERDNAARPVELLLLDPSVTCPVVRNGKLWFTTKIIKPDGETEQRRLRPMNVLHIPGLGWDGLNGWSVVRYGATSIGDARNAQRFTEKYYQNGTHLNTVLTIPMDAQLSAEDRKQLREGFERMQQGIDSVAKTAVLHSGITAEQMQLNARDAQLLESKLYSLTDIANWFGLPPHKLGDSSRVAYNSLEQENQSFLDEALDPWMVTLEQECNRKLLSERERENDSHYVEFNRKALIRIDIKTRYEAHRIALGGAPFTSINEVRRAENLNDSEQEWADDILLPANNYPQAVVGEAGEGAPEPDDTRERMLLNAADEALIEAENRVRKRLHVHVERRGLKQFADEFAEKHLEQCRAILTPACMMSAAVTGRADHEQIIDECIEELKQEIVSNELRTQ